MKIAGRKFLEELADAYNSRNPKALSAFFALDDPRFRIFEEFSGELMNSWGYAQILSMVEEATGTMSFELLDSCRYGDFLLLHAIQRIEESPPRKEREESIVRVTLFLSLQGGYPKILSGHYSSMMLCFPKRETVIRWRGMGESA